MEEQKQFYPPLKSIWNTPSIATTQWVQVSTPSLQTKLSFKTQVSSLTFPQLSPKSYMLLDNYCIVLLTKSRKNHVISPEPSILALLGNLPASAPNPGAQELVLVFPPSQKQSQCWGISQVACVNWVHTELQNWHLWWAHFLQGVWTWT